MGWKSRQAELLFTGIAGKDHDHGVHAFVFGPDGKLYFNMGKRRQAPLLPATRDLPLHGPVDKVEMKPVVDLDGKEVNNLAPPIAWEWFPLQPGRGAPSRRSRGIPKQLRGGGGLLRHALAVGQRR